MKSKIITNTISTLRIVAISSLTIFTLYTVEAWVGPTLSAPNGNVGGPLTTATSTQIKTGSLGVLDNFSIGNTLIVNGGFRFATTSAGAGKVLMSDASGNASWQTPSSSGNFEIINGVSDTTYTKNYTGNVLIVYSANVYEGGLANMGWRFYLNDNIVNSAVGLVNYQGGLSPVWYQRYAATGNFTVRIDQVGGGYRTTPQIIIYYL